MFNRKISPCKLTKYHKACCRICGKSKAFTTKLEITGRKSICICCSEKIQKSSFDMYIKILHKKKMKNIKKNQCNYVKLILQRNNINISDHPSHSGINTIYQMI
jgi:hypothetical protein